VLFIFSSLFWKYIKQRQKHLQFADFREEYARRYRERDFSDLRRAYDNDVLGVAIKKVSAEYLDWCKGLAKAYKTPMRHTVLGKYLMHWKAKHSKATYSQLGVDQ
jgi:hypothetical protein